MRWAGRLLGIAMRTSGLVLGGAYTRPIRGKPPGQVFAVDRLRTVAHDPRGHARACATSFGVAVVALILAVSGDAVAATSGSSGRILACVHHSGGGLYVAHKCAKHDKRLQWSIRGPQGAQGPQGGQGPQGAQGLQGAQGVAGAPATKLFATVKSDGTIDASSPGVQVFHAGTGVYEVNFGQDVTHCAAVATIGVVPVCSTPGTNTGANPGYARTDVFSAGKSIPTSGYPSGDTVVVTTVSGSGDATVDDPFNLAVFC